MEEISVAAKALYEQLTPDQQAKADPRLATLVQEALLEASSLPVGRAVSRRSVMRYGPFVVLARLAVSAKL